MRAEQVAGAQVRVRAQVRVLIGEGDHLAGQRDGPLAAAVTGDRLCAHISHPCTTLDKWRLVPVVDNDYAVVDGLLTFF